MFFQKRKKWDPNRSFLFLRGDHGDWNCSHGPSELNLLFPLPSCGMRTPRGAFISATVHIARRSRRSARRRRRRRCPGPYARPRRASVDPTQATLRLERLPSRRPGTLGLTRGPHLICAAARSLTEPEVKVRSPQASSCRNFLLKLLLV
jgi:hypothetical protein